MRKIIITLALVLSVAAYTTAGTWVIGANQVSNFLDVLEQGDGEEPPVAPEGTDLDVWEVVPGIVLTDYDVATEYMDHNEDNHWRGFESIDFSGEGYKQKEGTLISFIQPSLVEFDYAFAPDGYDSFSDYWDANDLSWLEELDFSGNDFHSIEIDGGPYQVMPLKKIDLSNNPNLTDLVIINLALLEEVNLSGTGLDADDIEMITEDIHEFSPDAVVISDESSYVKPVNENKYRVHVQGDNLVIRNMPENGMVNVYDMFGRNLISSTESTISMKTFNQGVYVVRINDSVTKIKK